MLVLRGLIGSSIQLALLAALLLIPAGRLDWPRATAFLASYGFVMSISIVVMARVAPASLEARLMAPAAHSQPLADRIVSVLLFSSLLVWFAFVPIDVFHLRLLPRPSFAVSLLGAALVLVGYGIDLASLLQNAFAAPIVKDQSERGQVLVDRGLYAHIRHPFYLGLMLFLAGLALWLQSYAAALGLSIPLVCLIARIRVEEQTLRETLPGYADYERRVRHRLLPSIW